MGLLKYCILCITRNVLLQLYQCSNAPMGERFVYYIYYCTRTRVSISKGENEILQYIHLLLEESSITAIVDHRFDSKNLLPAPMIRRRRIVVQVAASVAFVYLASLLYVSGQETPSLEPGERQISENCDLQAWETFLKSGRDGQPTNEELLEAASRGCRAAIKKLTQGYFGPASHYDRFLVGCKGICQQWDALQAQGRGTSRCTCEDLDTCDQNSFFWMCKTLYECR